MTQKRAAASLVFLALCASVASVSGFGQNNVPSSLRQFFEAMLKNPSALPKFEELNEVTARIADTRAEDIERALPLVLTALSNQDEHVKSYACGALFAIARRPDGAVLLREHIKEIGDDLLNSQFQNIQAGELTILGTLRPPPPEVASILLRFLKTKHNANVQAGAIFELLHIAPDSPEVTGSVREFLSRPIGNDIKVAVLNALGDPKVRDARLIGDVVAALQDSDDNVRSTAIQALTRIGKPALERAEPALRHLAADPNQSEQVARDAKSALQRLDSLRKSDATH